VCKKDEPVTVGKMRRPSQRGRYQGRLGGSGRMSATAKGLRSSDRSYRKGMLRLHLRWVLGTAKKAERPFFLALTRKRGGWGGGTGGGSGGGGGTN